MAAAAAIAEKSVLDSGYSWRRLAVTWAACTIGNVSLWSAVSIMPAIEAEFDSGRAGSALTGYAAASLGFGLGSGLTGKAIDRYAVTPTLIAVSLSLGVLYFLASISESLVVLGLLHFAIGAVGSATFAPMVADISLWFDAQRGIAVATAAAGNYCAGAIWPLVLAGTLEAHGWRVVYRCLAVGVPSGIIPLSLLLRRRVPAVDMQQANDDAAANAAEAKISPRFLQWLLSLAAVGCCVAMAMPQIHLVSMCVDLGFGSETGSQMLSVLLFGGITSRLSSGLIADRLGGVKTLLLGSSLQCLGLGLYLLYLVLPSPGEHSAGPLYAVSLIFGLSQGGIIPSYAVVLREFVPASEAGARVGFVIGNSIVGMALGSWAAGWLHDLSGYEADDPEAFRAYIWAFVNSIGWNLLNIAIMIGLLRRQQAGRKSSGEAGRELPDQP
jgi:MFS family permease